MKAPSKVQQLRDNLAKTERTVPPAVRLASHEAKIEKHLVSIDTSFFEIGRELAEIQAEGDYAGTFEQYLKERWGKSRDWGYKMIEGYRVKAELPENVESIIQNQAQALAIGKTAPEKRAEVLKETAKRGPVTPKKIKEVAAEFHTVHKDGNGVEIPKALVNRWENYQSIAQDVKKYINVIRGECTKDSPFGALPKEFDRQLSILYANMTLEVCSCGKGCKNCFEGIKSTRKWK